MSGRIVGEVFDHAPDDLPTAQMLVLVALADDARERDRTARFKSDVATIAYRTRLSRGTVHNALSKLKARGLIRPVLKAYAGRSQEYVIAELTENHRFNGKWNGSPHSEPSDD